MENKYKAFTLIEIMVVIVIIMIITTGLVIPYNLYSNISKVKISKEIINQNINIARNSSAGLIDYSSDKSQNIALFFKEGESIIHMVGFPYDYTGAIISTSPKAKLLKEVRLENNVTISEMKDNVGIERPDVIMYFKSPNGELDTYMPTSTGILSTVSIGFKNAKTGILSKVINIK